MGIGTPKSQKQDASTHDFSPYVARGVRAIVPDAIAQRAALSGKAPNKAQQSAKNEDATRFFCDGARRTQTPSSQM